MLLVLLLLSGCGKNKIDRNPYFSSVSFNIDLNLNLPAYDDLRYAGGGVSIRQGGINGLLVFNLNGNYFLAWEASCPNHSLKNCSKLSITGVLAECSCEGFQYSLATGQLIGCGGRSPEFTVTEGGIISEIVDDNNTKVNCESIFPMIFYTVRRSGNTLFISN